MGDPYFRFVDVSLLEKTQLIAVVNQLACGIAGGGDLIRWTLVQTCFELREAL